MGSERKWPVLTIAALGVVSLFVIGWMMTREDDTDCMAARIAKVSPGQIVTDKLTGKHLIVIYADCRATWVRDETNQKFTVGGAEILQ